MFPSKPLGRIFDLLIYLFIYFNGSGLLPTTFLNVLNILNVIQFGVYLLITM